jgi:hypothetical protein
MKKRILIVNLYDYYLFEYLEPLAIELKDRGYDVSILTADSKLYDKFKNIGISIDYLPLILRIILRRVGNVFIRVLYWLYIYIWVFSIKSKYDFSIVPWDNKPIWYLISKNFPSLTIHNTTNLMNLEFEIKSNASKKNHSFMKFIEKVTRKKIMPRFGGVVMKHNKFWYIDKILGYKSTNLVQGLTGINYVATSGNSQRKSLVSEGAEQNGTKIFTTGGITYDGFMEFSTKFTSSDKRNLIDSFNLPLNEDMYSLFLSPSSFSKAQIGEITNVIETVIQHNPKASFCIKFHPKTEQRFFSIFTKKFSAITPNFNLINGFTGDLQNLKIILSSKCTLQKQSSVGFIAMLTSKPIISYNFIDTDYYDDMYKIMDISFHSESPSEMLDNLKRLDNNDELNALIKKQDIGCFNFCKKTNSASKEVVNIIDNHFNK